MSGENTRVLSSSSLCYMHNHTRTSWCQYSSRIFSKETLPSSAYNSKLFNVWCHDEKRLLRPSKLHGMLKLFNEGSCRKKQKLQDQICNPMVLVPMIVMQHFGQISSMGIILRYETACQPPMNACWILGRFLSMDGACRTRAYEVSPCGSANSSKSSGEPHLFTDRDNVEMSSDLVHLSTVVPVFLPYQRVVRPFDSGIPTTVFPFTRFIRSQ